MAIHNNQTVQVNVLDADTEKPIDKNISFLMQVKYPHIHAYESAIGGSCKLNLDISSAHPIRLTLVDSQIAALGYDIRSVRGSTIVPVIDPVTGIPYLPRIINIYIRKAV